ncbi:MAG: peptidoglycan-binding protein [Muribaculaceae bacterium]
MAQGTLAVQLTIGGAEPITSGKVVISDDTGQELYTLYTNESGKTIPVTLEAPPAEYSLGVGEPQPYSAYNIRITADGFKDVVINGVQVFAGTEALQNVAMTAGQGEIVINIPPPVLWGDYPEKEPEEEVKEIPPETGFVVLDRVVIPEYVVVKDGPPSGGAMFTMCRQDYIKNVASVKFILPGQACRKSLLYSHCFKQGFRMVARLNFNTNSTDMKAFNYGRTIYEDISIIVDEMFTNYIKREGEIQPLFAQYCDGRNVVCPNWLSQWGSAALAEQGYSAMDILRYYYGNDIYLEQAESVSGVPVSFPGENLTIGSRGNDVRTIQSQLNTISRTYSAIPRLAVDGVYGEATVESVKAFQNIFNMPQTGIVDLATWYQISQIYVALERLAE